MAFEVSNYRKPIEDFFDAIDALKEVYYENIRLKERNEELIEKMAKQNRQLAEMFENSNKANQNWINAILEGKLKLTEEG